MAFIEWQFEFDWDRRSGIQPPLSDTANNLLVLGEVAIHLATGKLQDKLEQLQQLQQQLQSARDEADLSAVQVSHLGIPEVDAAIDLINLGAGRDQKLTQALSQI
jgi:hypothetical protein